MKTKVKVSTTNDFLFADHCALNAASEAKVQHSVDKFVEACNNFGLTISTKKTEVINVVDKFTYLGSTLARSVIIDDELNARLAKASAAFGRLNKKVWNRRGITAKTKIIVYLTTFSTAVKHG